MEGAAGCGEGGGVKNLHKDPLRKFAEDFQRGKAGRTDYEELFDDGDLKGKAGPLHERGWDEVADDFKTT